MTQNKNNGAKGFTSRLLSLVEAIYPTLLAILCAFIVGAIIISIQGEDPLDTYKILLGKSFGSKRNIIKSFREATPLIFTGLAVMFAYKGGMFNIGAQGQMIMGALTAATVGAFGYKYGLANPVVILLLAGFAGFAWAFLAGALKALFGVHEVISTIMLNLIAALYMDYLIGGPIKAGGAGGNILRTPNVVEAARLPLLTKGLYGGIIVAVIAAAIVWFIFQKTIFGYNIKAVGSNQGSSENAGISIKWITMLTLGLSGMLAGLGGAEQVIGTNGYLTTGMLKEYGFDGIAVALIGRNNPFGIIIAAVFYAGIRSGGVTMQTASDVPKEIIDIIQALIIVFVAGENIFRVFVHKMRLKSKQQKIKEAN